jgi:PKD repeat protein
VELNGAGSSDPDAGDGVVEYTFDFGDGSAPVTQSSPEIEHTYTEVGNYQATLTVKDSRGAASTNSASAIIQVIPEGDFYTVPPCRLLDTRTQQDGAAPVQNGNARTLDVTAVTQCGVSPLATAVAINITITQPTGTGNLQVYPADLPQPPITSTINFTPGMTRANNALTKLSANARIKLRPVISGSGTTHVIVDVVGFFIAQQVQ